MKTFAVLSLFTLAPAVAFTMIPARAFAQQIEAPRPFEQPVALAQPYQQQMPEPYQPPDPYETAADPSQIDWPQDTAAEEPAVDSYDDGYDPQAYTEFQDELSPYGNWIDDSTYGRVWAPEASLVGTDFTPYYTGGHWLLSEFGWTWVSDFSWGWAPFHYGRWIIVSGYGWCWVPGTMWGPAWVAWRAGDGYVGWAALPPRGVSVTATYGYRSPWRFSRAADLGAPKPRCVPARDTRGMFHRTLVVANDRVLTRGGTTVHINAGPRHVTNAAPVRLTSVAPQAFPQRAIYPRTGVNMSARPWIRAATTNESPAENRTAGPFRGAPSPSGAGASHLFGRTPARTSPPAAHAPSGSYAPPLRTYNPPRPVAPSVQASNQPAFGSSTPRIYNPPPVNSAPRVYNAPSASTAPHVYNTPPTSNAPRIYNAPAGSSAPRIYNTPPATVAPHVYGTPPSFGAPRANNAPEPRVYNPPPRTFATSPAVNPTRTFNPAPAQAPAFHPQPPQSFAPAPSHNFSAPAAPSGSFGNAGGGAHFGGTHRR
jgi:hypothetical protein